MTVVKTQVCSKCGRELPLTAEYFHRDKYKTSGFKSECKDCNKKRREENKDRYNARAKEYYRENIAYFKNKPRSKYSGKYKPLPDLHTRVSTGNTSKQDRLKQEAVERLGGGCECCGVTGPLSILQFHHRDPATKLGPWRWMARSTEEVRNAELDKCSLLCANCHFAYHNGDVEYDEWSGYNWKEPLEYNYRTVA